MSNSVGLQSYLHIEGFEQFHRESFNKRKVRAGMRKAGMLVSGAAQLNVALARGAGKYPISRTGALVNAIKYRVSRSGFMVKIAPDKTPAMGEHYYPAYLHWGVKQGRRLGRLAAGEGLGKSNRRGKGKRAEAVSQRKAGVWRIEPRANYIEDALQDKKMQVQKALRDAFAAALA